MPIVSLSLCLFYMTGEKRGDIELILDHTAIIEGILRPVRLKCLRRGRIAPLPARSRYIPDSMYAQDNQFFPARRMFGYVTPDQQFALGIVNDLGTAIERSAVCVHWSLSS